MKKLSINKETVANLNNDLLGQVKAGDSLPISLETDCYNQPACPEPSKVPIECHNLDTGAVCL